MILPPQFLFEIESTKDVTLRKASRLTMGWAIVEAASSVQKRGHSS